MICHMHMWSSEKSVCRGFPYTPYLYRVSVGTVCPEFLIMCNSRKYLSYHQGLLTARGLHVTVAYLYSLTKLCSQVLRQYTSYFTFVILKVVTFLVEPSLGSHLFSHICQALNSYLSMSRPFLIRFHHTSILKMRH